MNHGLIYQLQLIFQGQIELNFIGAKSNSNRIKVATEYAFPLFFRSQPAYPESQYNSLLCRIIQ